MATNQRRGKGIQIRSRGSAVKQARAETTGLGPKAIINLLPERKQLNAPSVEEPCAQIGVNLGYKLSQSYQSVHIDVSVSIPWDPSDIQKGLARALKEADVFLADSSETVQGALEALAEEADG